MMNINRVNISGHLTRDPELRATLDGIQVMRLGVAVNERRKSRQTGEWENYPNFINCVMFGAHAEAVFPLLAKGVKVAIEGKLRYSAWEQDGKTRSKVEIIIETIEIMVASTPATSFVPSEEGVVQ